MATNTQVVTPAAVEQRDVHIRKNSLARLTIAYWNDRANAESYVQLTNPIGQHLAFYVSAEEKVRVIAEIRAAVADWEKAPA